MSMPPRPSIDLRDFTADDVGFFASLASDPRVTSLIGNGQPWSPEMISTRTDAALRLDAVELDGACRWFIAEESNTPVGLLVSTRSGTATEIGYWVSPDHWGRGLAGAIVDGALALVPGIFGAGRLSARVDPANLASARVLTKRGFRFEGSRDGLDHYFRDIHGPVPPTAGHHHGPEKRGVAANASAPRLL